MAQRSTAPLGRQGLDASVDACSWHGRAVFTQQRASRTERSRSYG